MEKYKHSRGEKEREGKEGNLVFFQSHWPFNYITKHKVQLKKKKSLSNHKYKPILISWWQNFITSTPLYCILVHKYLFSFQSSKFYN